MWLTVSVQLCNGQVDGIGSGDPVTLKWIQLVWDMNEGTEDLLSDLSGIRRAPPAGKDLQLQPRSGMFTRGCDGWHCCLSVQKHAS